LSFFQELQRRNVVRVGVAYVVIGWLLAQVAEFAFENFGAPEWVLKTFVVLLLLGLPLVLFFAWAFELTPEGVKLEKHVDRSKSITPETGRKLDYAIIAGGVLVIGMIFLDYQRDSGEEAAVEEPVTQQAEVAPPAPPAAPDKSIAVLPFVAMTAAQDDEFFADGLSEELLNVLAKIEGLKVAGRTSSFYYKGRNEDLRKIGEALGVAHILEGSVRRAGNTIRVTAQLIEVEEGFHLWSETYERADGNTFAIQDEISRNVANALQAEILGAPADAPSVDENAVEAQNVYLIAQAAMARRTLPAVRQARELYAKATELVPDNPAYFAGYAYAVALQYWNSRDISSEEAIAEAGGAIEHALGLGEPAADTLAIAGLVEELRALALNESEAKSRALAYYQRALEKDPDNILARQWLASIYLDINEPELARENFEKVVELDPLNTLSLTGLANAYFGLGQYEEARLHLFKIQSLFPDLSMAYRYISNIEFQAGRLDKASYWMDIAARLDPSPFENYQALFGYVSLGWADKALEAAERYREVSDGIDISRLVQARLDLDFETLSKEAQAVFEQTGDTEFAALSAWSDSIRGECTQAIGTLERQYPSLKGEVIEYLDGSDLINAVLLAHCYAVTGDDRNASRLTGALIASEPLSDKALDANPARRLVRVAAHAVRGNVATAISELQDIDIDNSIIMVSAIALPVDELPIFEALYGEPPFREYATRERYRVASQARKLASGETREEILAAVEAAGYSLSH
jgi:TolB-like protein